MAEAEQKTPSRKLKKNKKEETLGRIEPAQSNSSESEESLENQVIESEKLLIGSTRLLLRQYGIRKSAAAIRDAVDQPHDIFKPENAVSALSNLGFKSSFGNIKIQKSQLMI